MESPYYSLVESDDANKCLSCTYLLLQFSALTLKESATNTNKTITLSNSAMRICPS